MQPRGRSTPDLLNYPFQGRDWEPQLLLLSILMALISLVLPPLAEMIEMGYAAQAVRGLLLSGAPPALPGRIPWRAVWRDGWRWWLVSLIYNLPALLVFLGAAGWLVWRYGLPEERGWPGLAQGWPLLVGGLFLSTLLALLGAWLSNLAVMNLLRRDRLSAAFALRDWGRLLAARPGAFAMALLRVLVISLGITLAQFVVSIPAAVLVVLPLLVGAFFSLYQRLISAAVYAAAFRDALEVEEA